MVNKKLDSFVFIGLNLRKEQLDAIRNDAEHNDRSIDAEIRFQLFGVDY